MTTTISITGQRLSILEARLAILEEAHVIGRDTIERLAEERDQLKDAVRFLTVARDSRDVRIGELEAEVTDANQLSIEQGARINELEKALIAANRRADAQQFARQAADQRLARVLDDRVKSRISDHPEVTR